MSPTQPSESHDPITLTCNLAEAGAFASTYQAPPTLVIEAFARGPLHECRVNGKCDLARVVADIPQQVSREQAEVTRILTQGFGSNIVVL